MLSMSSARSSMGMFIRPKRKYMNMLEASWVSGSSKASMNGSLVSSGYQRFLFDQVRIFPATILPCLMLSEMALRMLLSFSGSWTFDECLEIW